jgi:NAD(P)-dependent dehydrogenase (short-subunit alcohol dehydrogenase family)
MTQLNGKIALIVGGSRGLGRTIASAYADAGAHVAIASRSLDSLTEVAQLIRAKNRRAFIFEMDVTDSESVAKMIDAVNAEFGRIDILVNSAGVAWVERADSMSDGTWKWMMDTNLTGTFYCCREALRVMIPQKSGCIINLASVAGSRAISGLSAYSATKGGIIMFTKTLALENIRHNIRVNALAPGYFRTDMNAATLDDPQAGPKLLQLIPMRRAGEPEEINGLAVYLASDQASYVTGEVFYISGGMTAQ